MSACSMAIIPSEAGVSRGSSHIGTHTFGTVRDHCMLISHFLGLETIKIGHMSRSGVSGGKEIGGIMSVKDDRETR